MGELGACRQAEFPIGSAGDIARAAECRAYLVQLNHANGVQGGLEFAIAPDSNINAAHGAAADQHRRPVVYVSRAPQRGWSGAANVEVRLRYIAGGYGRIREYGGSDYDDELIGFSAGPELVTQASRFSLSGVEGRAMEVLALYTAPGRALWRISLSMAPLPMMPLCSSNTMTTHANASSCDLGRRRNSSHDQCPARALGCCTRPRPRRSRRTIGGKSGCRILLDLTPRHALYDLRRAICG